MNVIVNQVDTVDDFFMNCKSQHKTTTSDMPYLGLKVKDRNRGETSQEHTEVKQYFLSLARTSNAIKYTVLKPTQFYVNKF